MFEGGKDSDRLQVIHVNKYYKVTREGSNSELYDIGYWYAKLSAIVTGPVWRLYRRHLFFGWVQESVTNNFSHVLRWKQEYFKNE